MPTGGWKALLAGAPWFRGADAYPIPAYSEFMPPPRLGRKAYPFAEVDSFLVRPDDPEGWPVSEFEEAWELQLGLNHFAQRLVRSLVHLTRGDLSHEISRHKLTNNVYWTAELAERAASLTHEAFVILMPLALSRTQDDKGRVRWTLFGGSEQGPSRGFWRSFWTNSKEERPAPEAEAFVGRLLQAAYGEKSLAGFRILPVDEKSCPWFGGEGPLPSWTKPYRWSPEQSLRGVKYLLTFRPFPALPPKVRQAYLASELHLLPFPGSLLFWGVPAYLELRRALPLAAQIPLLHQMPRWRGIPGVRVPQSGWFHVPRPGAEPTGTHHGPVRDRFQRTHRWDRVLRDQDELALLHREERLLHVLFSSIPDDLGLYDKPMARNVQLWDHEHHLVLDGPRATPKEIHQALEIVERGGWFGYRFKFPAMHVGQHEIYWQRPLVAYWSAEQKQALVLPDAPLGYLTAYRADRTKLDRPIELWPRLEQRPLIVDALRAFPSDPHCRVAQINVRRLHESWRLRGESPLPRTFARQLLIRAKEETLDGWLDSLPSLATDAAAGRRVADGLRQLIEPEPAPLPRRGRTPVSLTFAHSARRSFEVAYWKAIAALAEGCYLNKNNADCVRDPVTQRTLTYPDRHLHALGEHLLAYYRREADRAGMAKRVLVGELPFTWQTDCDFSWSSGWLENQAGQAQERNLITIIPGRNRGRAVIMGDHYDTAYMEDRFERARQGNGARVAACGADDNHSATAALMLAAPILMDLSRAGQLGCDVWLIHLTGEEFPADCLGARNLSQRLVEGTLRMRLKTGRWHDLSRVEVAGVYVLDMVGHNNDHARDIFQIAPGTSRASLELAYQAHLANEIWNGSVPVWNERTTRQGRGRGRRSPHGAAVPPVAEHLALSGEVRPPYSPRSTLYNTDGQIFSDAGVPVVLFMENYDINRTGYHDSHDTMANIDLDYGAAVAAIAIESVARATHV